MTVAELLDAITDHRNMVRSEYQIALKGAWSSSVGPDGDEIDDGGLWNTDAIADAGLPRCGPYGDLVIALRDDTDKHEWPRVADPDDATSIWVVSCESGFGVDVTTIVRGLVER